MGGGLVGHRHTVRCMVWSYSANMSDDEFDAIWLYLQSIPALPFGQR